MKFLKRGEAIILLAFVATILVLVSIFYFAFNSAPEIKNAEDNCEVGCPVHAPCHPDCEKRTK